MAAIQSHATPLSKAASELCECHHISDRPPRPIPVWVKLGAMPDWLRALRETCLKAEPEATKAAEWLLDNYYQVDRAIRQIHKDMPRAFYMRLPSLQGPDHRGLPRVYYLAHGLLDAAHLQLSLGAAVEFVNAYQETTSLTTAELWAFPTMLRLACFEILTAASKGLFPILQQPFETSIASATMESIDPTERFARTLACLQIISSISWKDFFDRTSHVEAMLQSDPAKVYPDMEFDTRDQYRKTVEEIAKGSGLPEPEIARRIVEQAGKAAADPRRGHVGFWLIESGRRKIEREAGFRPTIPTAISRWIKRHAGPIYATALIIVGGAALALPGFYLSSQNADAAAWIASGVLTLIPASILSITVVNWICSLLAPPRLLPKLDFQKAIPANCRTAIVMPVIVDSVKEARALIERLEMHWRTNPDPHFRYVLLSDYTDAPAQVMPSDELIAQTLIDGVRRLNKDYNDTGAGPFHLLHRPRHHNPCEACWMAWERKRGKLEEFNKYILSGNKDGFAIEEGDTNALRDIRFVLTVDADTVLPIGGANRLIGVISHPLNRPEFNPVDGRVTAGYTVIQPRIEISPESGPPSHFLRFFAGDTAIDIYSRAVSDVYQDLFGSAVYVGKGIYDVESFDQSLKDRIPQNALLSHDLFEGAHGRAALASDIVLYDSFPTTYLEYVRRWHRWVRGDWQLLPWLRRRVPGAGGKWLKNRLTLLDRWKILDNLRRSLIPSALVLLAVTGWFALPGNAWVWTTLTVLASSAHLFTDLVTGISRWRSRAAVRSTVHRFANHAGRWTLAVVFLLHEAAASLDAIARTLWRLTISRRRLLEWTSAAHTAVQLGAEQSRRETWREMWIAPALSIMLAITLAYANPAALPAATPLLLLWFLSPEIARWISRPYALSRETLNRDARAFLRQVARRTWYFFETFVGPEDNWLPPDNFQEDPHAKIGHRTSPTNIGMLFVSSLTAWDFGYLGSTDLIIRIESGLNALHKLDRYRGHFLNWYDTRTLNPLEPRYVSTVDSGNLAVCLITLKEGLLEAASGPALRADQWDGLKDTFDMLAAALDTLAPTGAIKNALRTQQAATGERIAAARGDPQHWQPTVTDLSNDIWPALEETIAQSLRPENMPSVESLREINVWLERFNHDLSRLRWDIESLLPWLTLTSAPPPACANAAERINVLLAPSISIAEAKNKCAEAVKLAHKWAGSAEDNEAAQWFSDLTAAIENGSQRQNNLRNRLRENADRANELAFAMDFRLLYNQETKLFNIGYNVSSDRIDPHHYDLLATEARLASYFAIAKGDVPPEHWRYLGRPVTRIEGELSLLSWNGSMFEYLMPSLWLRNGEGTLLDQAEKTAVTMQRRYAEELGVPWGVSESGFAARDPAYNYQYRAFGVPGLGLRRGLSQDIVVAPYASALALSSFPATATHNLRKLAQIGLLKSYGFIEAADFTPERIGSRAFSPVHAFMTHHQGMILTAIGNALCKDVLIERFSKNMQMRTASLLLQERTPWELTPETAREEESVTPKIKPHVVPTFHPWAPQTAGTVKQMHLLGNGRFASWISDAGGGALWWRRHALTRWRPDPTCDAAGGWVYVRDKETDAIWSVGRQPTGVISHDAHVSFHPHMVEFHRRDNGVAIRMEVGIAAGDDLEIRLITITNETDRKRTLEITSYGEVSLAPPLDDERHPAFSKLFVSSEYLSEINGLLFTRRAHLSTEQPPAMLHRLVFDEKGPTAMNFETDRRAFFGRNGTPRTPQGLMTGLTNTTGWTLDPIMALHAQFEFAPREQRQFAFVTVAAGSPESALETAERYANLASLEWALTDASREASQEAQQLDLKPTQLPVAQSLASLIMGPHPALRADMAERKTNLLGQPRLWSLGISGDYPILLVHIDDTHDTELLRLLVRVHDLWRRRLFHVDMVLMRRGVSGYVEPVRERVLSLFREMGAHEILGRNGGVHIIFADQVTEEDRRLLECAASVILDESKGPLPQQLAVTQQTHGQPPFFEAAGAPASAAQAAPLPPPPLAFFNEFGGFSENSKEYVIQLKPDEATPAPWSNILANDDFGCLVTERGGGFTWAVNSGENRITPWTNDPVCDSLSEALYLRDEETGEIWTPAPAPAGGNAACQIRHGAGYTTWLKRSHGLEQTLTVFVAPNAPVKFARLQLRDLGKQVRRVTATYYAEWQLGAMRSTHRPHVVCEYDPESHALLARNGWNPEFAERVAFLASSRPPHSLSTDRLDFLGRNGDMNRPAGLLRWDLGGRVNIASDPCAAFQVHLDIAADESAEVVFILGQGRTHEDAKNLIKKWRDPKKAERALASVREQWSRQLNAVTVKTPDPAFDLMLNQWLVYQALSSRIMARAGFYQAGGAIGFRDQLQDVLAILHVDPARARAHILDCAGHQFEEGDVLHWWHPPMGRGVRTRCSDDLLWLPYVTSQYVEATGDESILSEKASFLCAPPLSPKEDDRYALFETSKEKYSLFEHCVRAIERGITRGPQGLPLIGAGDWNDGMNNIGARGRGESVWLAWFAIATMTGFANIAARASRRDLKEMWEKRADDLRRTVDSVAWDGEWYVRAFDDDGHSWGSKTCDECRIDSIAQSWAVLSGGGKTERARIALRSAVRELVRDDQRLVRLFWPPIHETPRNPGYIKAYPPGIRENGGQYTHAAAWLGFALAELGDGDGAWRIFDIINPVRRTASRNGAERYRDEPYVLAADVAGAQPHIGKGGWSWYTGAASWTQRLGLEGILGLRLRNGKLRIKPCLPKSWGTARVEINKPTGMLSIQIEDPNHVGAGDIEITVDGAPIKGSTVSFPTGGSTRHVLATIRPSRRAQRGRTSAASHT